MLVPEDVVQPQVSDGWYWCCEWPDVDGLGEVLGSTAEGAGYRVQRLELESVLVQGVELVLP